MHSKTSNCIFSDVLLIVKCVLFSLPTDANRHNKFGVCVSVHHI